MKKEGGKLKAVDVMLTVGADGLAATMETTLTMATALTLTDVQIGTRSQPLVVRVLGGAVFIIHWAVSGCCESRCAKNRLVMAY